MKDLTGDWAVSFRVSGCIGILAGVLFMSEPIFRKRQKMVSKQTKQENILHI
jgi:hypothetical protein